MRASLAGLTALVALLASCDSDRRAISRDDLPTLPDEPAHIVEMGPTGFDQDAMTVFTDDLVRFVNVDDVNHGVRADDRIATGPLFPGEDTLVMFSEAGSYEVEDSEQDVPVLLVESRERPES